MKILIPILIFALGGVALSQDRKVEFGSAKKTGVSASNVYSKENGFGFEQGANVKCAERSCTSDKPFYFSVAVGEGNYRVTFKFGDRQSSASTVVKAELRRLMLERVDTKPGELVTR